MRSTLPLADRTRAVWSPQVARVLQLVGAAQIAVTAARFVRGRKARSLGHAASDSGAPEAPGSVPGSGESAERHEPVGGPDRVLVISDGSVLGYALKSDLDGYEDWQAIEQGMDVGTWKGERFAVDVYDDTATYVLGKLTLRRRSPQ